MVLYGEPTNLTAGTTYARGIGLISSAGGIVLLGLFLLMIVRSVRDRSESVRDLRVTVRDSLDAAHRAAFGSIFINYRQGLADLAVAGLRRELCARLGPDKVFYDLRSIPPGTPYPAELRAKLAASTVLLAVIAPDWLARLRERENVPGRDWVRYEISTALRSGKVVIPVLLDGAPLPGVAELPADLETLAHQQACPLRSMSFDEDLTRLVEAVESVLRIRN